MTDITIGLDIGTTSVKGLSVTPGGDIVGEAHAPTSWLRSVHDATALDLTRLMESVNHVLVELGEQHAIAAIGIAGMAETGVLLDDADEPVWPAMAWHDPHGLAEIKQIGADSPDIARDFSWRTGLPYDAQATFSKVSWLSRTLPGAERGRVWLSVPEYVAYILTGNAFAERSLFSRTGFYDHPSGDVWHEAVKLAGLSPAVIPPLKTAGESWGPVLRGSASGALVTVAGHDHLVASVGAGIRDAGSLFNSCGTADVIVRGVDQWPDRDEFRTLAPLNISMGHHPLRGQFAVNGGTKAGFVLNRLGLLLGELPNHVPGEPPAHVSVAMPPFGDDRVAVHLDQAATAADVWSAAFDAIRRQSAHVNVVMDAVFGTVDTVICGGGWTRASAVRELKKQIWPTATFTRITEPGCLGAALLARSTTQNLQQEESRP